MLCYPNAVFLRASSFACRRLPLLALACAGFLACGEAVQRRPDVFLIVVDTLRADAILDPDGEFSTPALDRLAAEGVLFETAFAHAPMTLPSHMSLFSSRLPLETGVVCNGQPVPEDLPLLPAWMGQFGYESRGVTSLATLLPISGQAPSLVRAFDDYDTDYWNIDPAERVLSRIQKSLDVWDGSRPLFFFGHFCDPHEPYDSHQDTGRTVQVTIDGIELATIPSENMTVWEDTISLPPGRHEVEFLSRHRFKVRYFSCHEGEQKLQETWEQADGKRQSLWLERSGDSPADCRVKIWVNDIVSKDVVRERYAAEVEHADRYVGKVIQELKQRDLYDDSLILFTSDHGEALGERNHVGHVQNLTHDQIAVPLIIKLPRHSSLRGRLDPGRLVRHIDLAPTILDIAGLPALPGQKGLSLFSEDSGQLVHLAETHKPEAKKDKLALFDGRLKLIYTVDDDLFRMFDLLADPEEEDDIFPIRGSERVEWQAQLRSLGAIAVNLTRRDGDVDPELEIQLKALGYGE